MPKSEPPLIWTIPTHATTCSPPEVIARTFLQPFVEYLPELAPHLDEMTATYLRVELSLLTIDSATCRSADAMRGYLHRVFVPALELPLDG